MTVKHNPVVYYLKVLLYVLMALAVRVLAFVPLCFLVAEGAEAIVLACNTATSVAVKDLRAKYTIPIIGMEPAVKRALDLSERGRISF